MQKKFCFDSRKGYNKGFRDGFKDKEKKYNNPEYLRGYENGRKRRDVDL